jgi:predicted SnoaL-like aldol condensation-catalyzing enzyme
MIGFEGKEKNMLSKVIRLLAAALMLLVFAGAPVAAQSNTAHDKKNLKMVLDFWREVLVAHHVDLTPKYMAEGYIQHNPNVPTGRAAFVDFFSKNVAPQPIALRIKAPLVAILADGDLVTLVFVREAVDPKDPAKKYTTTWFDMFRLERGKIAEHWDPAPKRQ